jgi:hypothetical protein
MKSVVSCQLSVVSCQLSVVSCQLSLVLPSVVNSHQEEGRGKKEEGSSATDCVTDVTDVKERRKKKEGINPYFYLKIIN